MSNYIKIFEEFYTLLQEATKNIDLLSDVNGQYFIKAHSLIDCEQDIEMAFLNINSNMCLFIRKIYENEISEVKKFIKDNMDLQNKWIAKIRQTHNS